MIIIKEINKGIYAPYNDMVMWRRYNSDEGFKTRFKVIGLGTPNQTLDMENNIVVPYIEFFRNSDGDVVEALTRYKYYVVPNLPDWPAANDWFLSLARTPITAPYGVMDSIEATLDGLPQEIPNGYILQEPLG